MTTRRWKASGVASKTNECNHRRYETRSEAKASIREYIEIFYNRQRRHSRLGNLAPAVFHTQAVRRTPECSYGPLRQSYFSECEIGTSAPRLYDIDSAI